MKIKTSAVIVTTLAIALATAPAFAGGRGHYKKKHRPVHRQDPVLSLAYEVEQATRHVHRMAEQTSFGHDYRGQRALQRLHELDERARYFRKELKHYGPYAHNVRVDLRDLQRSFRKAEYSIRWLRTRAPVHKAFARLDYLMRDLDYALGARVATRHNARPHRGGGRDGYVSVGARWDSGYARIGFDWDDE